MKMILVDTSVWILILRDKSGEIVAAFRERTGSDLIVLSRFSQLELLQGAKDLKEWPMLEDYLVTQIYLEASADTWREAARIFFDMRLKGVTVGSPIDWLGPVTAGGQAGGCGFPRCLPWFRQGSIRNRAKLHRRPGNDRGYDLRRIRMFPSGDRNLRDPWEKGQSNSSTPL